MALACKRFSDVQRLKPHSLAITESALCGTARKMKGKRSTNIPWALPRLCGIIDTDWIPTWLALRNKHVPAERDWLVPSPGRTDEAIGQAHGTYNDALNMIQWIFTKHLGMNPAEAARYTVHSPRHWLPTTLAQLRVSRKDREDGGNWAPNSRCIDGYDSAACTATLAVKARAAEAYRNGWRQVGAFEVPMKEPPRSELAVPMEQPTGPDPHADPIDSESDIDETLDDTVPAADPSMVFVQNRKTMMWHKLSTEAHEASPCGWNPPSMARDDAQPDLPEGRLCARCFVKERKVWKRLGDDPTRPDPDYNDSQDDDGISEISSSDTEQV
jgi:hypothetical protein